MSSTKERKKHKENVQKTMQNTKMSEFKLV
jgi:hypothetical protein